MIKSKLSNPVVTPNVRVLAMIALSVGGFGIGTTEFVVMGLLPEIQSDMVITEAQAGNVISAYALGVVVGAPTIAALAARVPRRTLLLWLMVAFTVGNAGTVFAQNYSLLLISRFISGLPHGAYFGVASLVAAHLAEPGKKAKAVAMMMLGLPVANVIGVPVVAALGQHTTWRAAFAVVAAIGAVTIVAIYRHVPDLSSIPVTDPRTELSALTRIQVWFTLLVGMVGFGGMFAFYSYIAYSMTHDAGLSSSTIPLVQSLYGIGMVVGTYVGGWVAEHRPNRGVVTVLAILATLLALFPLASKLPTTALIEVFLIAATGSALSPALQMRLMVFAGKAQSLAAALNHAALNLANALGAWVGGLVIIMGFGFSAPALAGAGLAMGGLVILVIAISVDKRGFRNRTVAVPLD